MASAKSDWAESDVSVLVTGAGGFIGGHLIRRLLDLGIGDVRGVDTKPLAHWFQTHQDCEHLVGDLADPSVAAKSVEGTDIVFHLAADMGGMGFISRNDLACLNGARIGVEMAQAAANAGVRQVLFASSACVYPLRAQSNGASALKEDDAYPAEPPEGYGWEKLYSERLFSAYAAEHLFSVRLPRLHNVFGPNGSWRGGREKAPAALTRKVCAARRLGVTQIPVWGSGQEVRSYCYVDDAVDCLIALSRESAYQLPVNVGSERAVTTTELVQTISKIADWPVDLIFERHQPAGVPSRNADTRLVRELIGWQATTSLEDGLARVLEDIDGQLDGFTEEELRALLS
jgi:GDP-D-mannose 3', 5'-epimerase